ncbi:MAG: 23S rRNA (guanosine(2251)-2'-O)-methyltransferase RlmB, partial [Chloroflexota bacterium]
ACLPGQSGGKPGSSQGGRGQRDQRDQREQRDQRGPRRAGPGTRHLRPQLPVARGNDLLYGRNAVLEALRGERTLHRVWMAEGVRDDERIAAILELAGERTVPVEQVPREMLDDATRGANHQGVGLEAGEYQYAELGEVIGREGTVLVLDHLQDPQNFGTLLRAAEAAGVAGVIIPEDRAVAVTPAVVNASAGAVEHLPVAATPNLPRALEDLKRSGRWVLGLAGEAGAADLFTSDVPTPAALVVGAEGTGLGKRVRATCDLLVGLPMRGRVESLNAATAGSIALYDLLRRERAAGS